MDRPHHARAVTQSGRPGLPSRLQLTPRILWDRLFLTKFYEKKMKNMPLSADIIIDLHKKPKKVYSCKVFMRVTKQQ
jgi:hypothetical protein